MFIIIFFLFFFFGKMTENPIIIHPQAILQISDHFTRSKYFIDQIEFICGIIYGYSDGFNFEICSTVESLIIETDSHYNLDSEVYYGLHKHHIDNFKDEIPIGWYIISPINEKNINLLNIPFENKFEVFLRIEFLFNNENIFKIFKKTRNNFWNEINYIYKSELAERVGLIGLQSEGNAENQISFLKFAFKSLNNQLEKIENYLIKIKNKEIPFNYELVRKSSDIIQYFKHQKLKNNSSNLLEISKLSYLTTLITEVLLTIKIKYSK